MMDASLPQRMDIAKLSRNLGGNRTVVCELLDLYLKVTRDLLDKLETAMKDKDINTWLNAAHQVKGASLNVTARRMVSLSLEAEEIASLPHPQAEPVLYHLNKEFAHAKEIIIHYLDGRAETLL